MHQRNRTWMLGSNPAERVRQRTMAIEGGDGSTIDLDFSTGILDPRISFTRGLATASYVNSSGYVVTNAPANSPRFDYSPTNIGEQRGLLIEGLAINICLQSQALTTGWVNANMNTPTIPASPPTDPFGGTSASWKLVAASGLALHSWRHSVLTLTAATYTFSFWAKAAEYDRVVFSDPGTGIGACTFLLTNNGTATVITGTGNPTNAQIIKYTNDWYRCSVTMTTLATTYAFGVVGYPSGAVLTNFGAQYNADGNSGAYVTAMQIEIGTGASSYIPTGVSQVTRNAELCSMTGTNFSSWFNNATSGTFLVTFDLGRWLGNLGDQATQLAIGAYSSGTLTMLQSGNQTLTTSISGSIWGTTFNTASAITTINPKNNKVALTFNGLSTFATLNGVVGATATTTGSVSRLSLYIGSNDTRDRINGTIQSVKYYPTVFTSAQLQALTAL